MTKIKFYWHLHHDRLVESLTKPIKNRIEYIKKYKPKKEIKLRLKLLKPVKGKLPGGFIGARKKYREAWEKYREARKKYKPQTLALHKKECPNCPWDEKQKTIFPK